MSLMICLSNLTRHGIRCNKQSDGDHARKFNVGHVIWSVLLLILMLFQSISVTLLGGISTPEIAVWHFRESRMKTFYLMKIAKLSFSFGQGKLGCKLRDGILVLLEVVSAFLTLFANCVIPCILLVIIGERLVLPKLSTKMDLFPICIRA